MSSNISRRLRPLYLAAFLQSFMLWYTVEKLFMRSIGFDDADIGFMVAVYSAVMLAIDLPSGILADRWSRKGVLALASLSLTGAAIVGGLSNSITMYTLCAVFWGVFYACYAGMYESVVYDTLAEEKQSPNLFSKIYGRLQIADSAGLVASGLVTAFVATKFGLRETYFLSIPFAVLSIFALLSFREPHIHRAGVRHSLATQLHHTYRAIILNRRALPVVVSLVLKTTILFMMFEFAQLWLIALDSPRGFFGFAGALLYAAIGFGGWGAQHLHAHTPRRISLALLLTLASTVGLITLRNTIAVALLQFVFICSVIGLSIAMAKILHDMLPSYIRASAASATSTLGRLLIIPFALLFGAVSKNESVFSAAYIVLALGLLMSFFVMVSLRGLKVKNSA